MPTTPGITNATGGGDRQDAATNPAGSAVIQSLKDAGFSTLTEEIDFFSVSQFPIDASLFYQILPYRFLILQASTDANNQAIYKIISTFVLPINPTALAMSTSFAANNTSLADGMLVESNSIKMVDFALKGTTGVLPFRDTQANTYGGVFGRTTQAINQLVNTVNPTQQNPVFDNTGYVQFHKLYQFLEAWAYASKTSIDIRLAFDMQKDNMTYLVTPKTFNLTRDADSPLEYNYDITFQAWKRIKVNSTFGSTGPLYTSSPWLNPTSLRAILHDIKQAIAVVNGAIQVVKAAVADAESFVDQLRQVVLAVKNTINEVAVLVDMPSAIVQGLAGSIASSAANIKNAVDAVGAASNGTAKTFNNLGKVFQDAFQANGIQGNLQSPQNNVNVSVTTGSYTTSGSNPAGTIKSTAKSNINNPNNLNNPYTNPQNQLSSILGDRANSYQLLDAIQINNLKNIPQSVQNQIDNEYRLVKNFTRQSFEDIRNRTNQVSRNMSVYFGQEFPDYSKYYPNTSKKVGFANKPLTRSQMDILSALRTIATNLDKLCSQNTYNNRQSATDLSFNYVGSLLAGTGIPFGAATSKQAVPVPFAMNMSQIANFYLGDPNRSNEIVILNNLAPPFIDEEGLFQNFLVNATDQSFMIEDGSELRLNQKIILSSNTVNAFSVSIKNIKQISAMEWLITINSQVSLSNLKVSEAAKVQYFMQGTVSSRNTIYIPSNSVVMNNLPERLKPISYAPNLDGLNNFSLIDFLLTTDNDLAIDSTGSIGLAGGLTNLQQALRLKFLTVQGTNIFHPSYGAGVRIGSPSSKININKLKEAFTKAVQADQRFSEVLSLKIELGNGVLLINGTVSLAQYNQILPFGWTIPYIA